MGDVGGWGAHGGTKEARITLKQTVQGQATPAFQVRSARTFNPNIFVLLCSQSTLILLLLNVVAGGGLGKTY